MNKLTYALAALTLCISQAYAANNDNQPTFAANDDVLNVQNRCIVRFNDDLDDQKVTGLARALAAKANASVQYVYQHSIKGFTVNMPCYAADRIYQGESAIMSLTPDSVVSINKGKPSNNTDTPSSPPPSQVTPYGTLRVGGPVDGSAYTAWIIDTGIDLSHPDLHVDVDRAFSVITSKGLIDPNDENGHGTHVSGTIAAIDNDIDTIGVAAGATVVPVRVLDRRGSGTISGVIAGVDYVAANASPGDCANMSLGGSANSTLDAAVANAASKGVFFAIAAGNSGKNASGYSPARVNAPNVWTISAIDDTDTMPYWSNYGNPPVDFAAPGVDVTSLWKDGGMNTISGTSMATPHACAVLMLTGGHPTSSGTAHSDPDGSPDPIIHN